MVLGYWVDPEAHTARGWYLNLDLIVQGIQRVKFDFMQLLTWTEFHLRADLDRNGLKGSQMSEYMFLQANSVWYSLIVSGQ